MKPRHVVEYCRNDGGWAIRIPALPGVHSQASRLAQIPEQARSAIAASLSVDPHTFELDLLHCRIGSFA